MKRVNDDSITNPPGPAVHLAITTCCMREQELEAGKDATDCVLMQITSNPRKGATINLALGLKEGT